MDTDKIKYQINFLKKHGLFFEDYIEFYKKILALQAWSKKHINKDALSLLGRPADFDQKINKGFPLLEKNNFYIDERFSEFILPKLLKIFNDYQENIGNDEFKKFNISSQKSRLNTKELIRNFIFNKKEYFINLSDTAKLSKGLLVYIARMISFPFLETYRAVFLSYLAEKNKMWSRPRCPFCGNVPTMARLESETGQRSMWCGVCNNEWDFRRIQCPYCLNDDHSTLRYFYTDENEPYRVDVCEQCKGYIKTVDDRKLSKGHKVDMMTHDMVTIGFDLLAEIEGYHSTSWWFDSVEANSQNGISKNIWESAKGGDDKTEDFNYA